MTTIRERLGIGPHQPGQAITAAATLIEPTDEKEQQRIRKGPAAWQKAAWDAYDDEIGPEIGYGANYQANALSMLRLVPAVREDPRDLPTVLDADGDDDLDLTVDERAAMNATINRLGAGVLPISEVQRLLALNLFIAGDVNLVGYDDNGVETWDVLSVEELVLDPNGRGYARSSPGGGVAGAESLPEDAFIARLFCRHPRHSKWAYSSVKTTLGLVRELRILTWSIEAAASSRIPADILLLPNGLRVGPVDPTMAGQRDEAHQDPTVQNIREHFETPVKSYRSAAKVSPLQIWGDPGDLKEIRKIEGRRDIDSEAAKQRQELIQRIATGIDLPVEVLTGKADLNHWSAWLISEETFKYHLEPDARMMVEALTSGYYRPHLDKMGLEGTQRFCIWYDASPLVAHPNQAEDYRQAYDKYEVSGEALRRVLNIPEEDRPEDDEVAQRLWRAAVGQISVRLDTFPTPTDIAAGELPGNAVSDRQDQSPTPALPASPETVQPGPARTTPPSQQAVIDVPSIAALTASAAIGPLGPRLTQIEKALRLRLLQKCDDQMTRTLEKAGNKLRSLANKHAPTRALVAKVDVLEVGQTLGGERVEQLATTTEDLLAGAFVGLEASWTSWVRRAQEQALAGIDEHGDLDESDAVRTRAEMDRHREEGWSVLHAGLLALAARQLYAPNVEAPPRGEWSDFRVDPSIVREALETAGGGRDGQVSTDLLNGSTVHEALDAAGLEVTGFTWVTGDPVRPFEPHQDLGGESFISDDDPGLANTEGWPEVDFYSPGDHDGCLCSREDAITRRGDGDVTE